MPKSTFKLSRPFAGSQIFKNLDELILDKQSHTYSFACQAEVSQTKVLKI